jgi:hypothetical protein
MRFIKTCLILLTIIFSANSFSQAPVIEENVPKKTKEPRRGPNQKIYTHGFIGYGFILGGGEGSGGAINYGKSGGWTFGIRRKRKLSNFYAIGFELFYNVNTFSLKQDSSKLLPNAVLHNSEHIRTNELGLSFYNRFNFGKRGNRIGNFIDLGAYGAWVVGASHTYYDKHPIVNNANASNTTVTNKGLIYVSDFNYGAQARLGFNRIVFFGNYRLSQLFNGKIAAYPELPRLSLGLQIGLQ